MSPAQNHEPRFGYDAIRVPLYAMMSGRDGLVRPVIEFWSGLIAAKRPIPAWVNVETGAFADYAAGPGLSAIVAAATGTALPRVRGDADYYDAVLAMMASGLDRTSR